MGKILVVEDNPTNRILTVYLLEREGHYVLQAENATLGIRLAREQHPDLIFMDIQLPDMDGLEATKQLKSEAEVQDIPVYALSAFEMKGDKERIGSSGCEGYLSKPISHKDLMYVVNKVLAKPH